MTIKGINKMKKYLLGTMFLLPVFISGCATMLLNEHTFESKTEQGILLEDTLIAVGTPSKPIRGYEDALAIAGDKYSYLVKPSIKYFDKTIQNPLPIKSILNEVDLAYLSVGQYKQTRSLSEDTAEMSLFPSFDLLVTNTKRAMNHTIEATEITFMYLKQSNLVKMGEIERLQSLGFKCEAYKKYQRCFQKGFVDITVTKPVANKEQLQHLLKTPIPLNVRYSIDKVNPKMVASYALTPFTIAFDIVTSPIQLVGYLALASALSP